LLSVPNLNVSQKSLGGLISEGRQKKRLQRSSFIKASKLEVERKKRGERQGAVAGRTVRKRSRGRKGRQKKGRQKRRGGKANGPRPFRNCSLKTWEREERGPREIRFYLYTEYEYCLQVGQEKKGSCMGEYHIEWVITEKEGRKLLWRELHSKEKYCPRSEPNELQRGLRALGFSTIAIGLGQGRIGVEGGRRNHRESSHRTFKRRWGAGRCGRCEERWRKKANLPWGGGKKKGVGGGPQLEPWLEDDEKSPWQKRRGRGRNPALKAENE